MVGQLDCSSVLMISMASWMVALKVVLISKALHYPAMLVSMIMWVEWMVDNSALCFEFGLDLAVVMANHLWMGS